MGGVDADGAVGEERLAAASAGRLLAKVRALWRSPHCLPHSVHDQLIAIGAVRQIREPRSNQAVPKAVNDPAQLALGILGCCGEFHGRNYSPMPLVQRGEDLPFLRASRCRRPPLRTSEKCCRSRPGSRSIKFAVAISAPQRRQKRVSISEGFAICLSVPAGQLVAMTRCQASGRRT